MGTVLEQVGAQVWKGAFLLCELLLQLYRTGTICNRGYPCILELGSGTGFCSIFLAKLLQDPTCRIYVTGICVVYACVCMGRLG
jgi:methylase of polypeptide subunit release factors